MDYNNSHCVFLNVDEERVDICICGLKKNRGTLTDGSKQVSLKV
jgi:hypothetical protein